MLTGIKDVDREILSKVDDKELLKVCSIDKRFWNDVCDDDFLKRRLLSKYPGIEKYKEAWKDFFLKATFYISKMKEDFEYDYSEGDFKKQYNILKDNVTYHYRARAAAREGELPILIYAIKKGNSNIVARYHYMDVAAGKGHLDIVQYLITSGLDLHNKFESTLISAVSKGHLNVVKYLVENGADIHISDDQPLTEASKRGHLNVVKYLVEKGAVNNGEALREARNNGHLDVVQYLEIQK